MRQELLMRIENIKKECLVFDIETSSINVETGETFDIKKDFDNYVKYAKVKFFGAYSYLHNELYLLNFNDDISIILDLFREHKYLVGVNSLEFDFPILQNSGVVPSNKYFVQVDMQVILGKDVFRGHKNRAKLMGFTLPNNRLSTMAEVMGCETLKGDIDYAVFNKDSWTPQELEDIYKYLESDVLATKQLFEKAWKFWMPFTQFLGDRNIGNLSWLKSSIASLTYKSACYILGVEETYSDEVSDKEDMGGRVIEPVFKDARNVWYVDVTSLYPHIMAMFELFTQINIKSYCDQMRIRISRFRDMSDENILYVCEKAGMLFHSNGMFVAKGYYDITNVSILNKDMRKKLALRIAIKKLLKNLDEHNVVQIPIDPVLNDIVMSKELSDDDLERLKGLMYAIKIYINSFYGAFRSVKFEQIFQPEGGWDTCWIGQQINEYMEEAMDGFGFRTIAGDTDSIFLKAYDPINDDPEFVQWCLDAIVEQIQLSVPHPCDTFGIDIEGFLEYVKWGFDYEPKRGVDGKILKDSNGKKILVRVGKKKNYLYLKNGWVTIMGLPIKKTNGTKLGKKLLKDHLIPKIIAEKHANFSREYLMKIIDDNATVEDMAILYETKPADSYAPRKTKNGLVDSSNIYAQISRAYTDGFGGQVLIIKNKKVGIIGNGVKKLSKGKELGKSDWLYAPLDQCLAAGVTIDDLDFQKLYNELTPFYDGDQL